MLGWSVKGGIEPVLREGDGLSLSGRSRSLRLVSKGVNGLSGRPLGDHQVTTG